MGTIKTFFLFAFLFSLNSFAGPSLMILKNQFGEQSNNFVLGSVMPLVPGSYNAVSLTGSGAPSDGTTGANVADKGSLYFRQSNGSIYSNTGTKASPVWSAIGSSTNASIIAATLTAFSAGAGTVSSADSILEAFQKVVGNQTALQNGTFTPVSTQTVSAAGAINTTSMLTILANGTGGSYAATLAAPSSQDGQLKVLKMTTATHTVTLAMTNIAMSGGYTPAGTTTLTFTNAGDSAILMAVGSKWVYLGGSAVAS